jgi:hypothetical protein
VNPPRERPRAREGEVAVDIGAGAEHIRHDDLGEVVTSAGGQRQPIGDVECFISVEAVIGILCIKIDRAEANTRRDGGIGSDEQVGEDANAGSNRPYHHKRAICTSWSDKLDVPPELIRTSKALNSHQARVQLRRSRSCIIDGEAVACDDNGVTSFNRVRCGRHDESIFLYAFDLIELNADDLRRDPLEARNVTLEMILAKAGPGIRFNEHMEGDGETVFRHA